MKVDCYICEHFKEVVSCPDCKLRKFASSQEHKCNFYKHSQQRQEIVTRNIKNYYSRTQAKNYGYFD